MYKERFTIPHRIVVSELIEWLNTNVGPGKTIDQLTIMKLTNSKKRGWNARMLTTEYDDSGLYLMTFSHYQDLILFKMRWG